jgi:hypothetical protein
MMDNTFKSLYEQDYQLWLDSTINQLKQGDFGNCGKEYIYSKRLEAGLFYHTKN